jgi:serpin B
VGIASTDRNRWCQLLASVALALVAGLGTTPAPAAAARTRAAPSYRPAPATAAFGLDLMRHLGSGNLVFSPDSVSAALAMVGIGARGATAGQIASTIRVTSPAAFPRVGDLQRTLKQEQSQGSEAPTLEIADGLFLQQGFEPLGPFLSSLGQHFGAAPQLVDFADPSAVATVNAWVSEHTRGLIPAIVHQLSEQTKLLLANAIYLKADWKSQFKADATHPASFLATGGKKVQTPFMHETSTLRYGRGSGYAVVELPYANSTLALAVMLPTGQRLGALLGRLTPRLLEDALARARPRAVELSLPKFHLTFLEELNDPLQLLGLTRAFGPGADFSGIAPGVPLQIGQVEHGANFTVEEMGTVAAAATTVGIEATDAPARPIAPVAFDADRPFLFFLRDRRTGAVLFAGRLADPSASAG